MSAGAIRKSYADRAFRSGPLCPRGRRPPTGLARPAPRSWRAFREMFALLQDDFHLVVPDPPGFGESTTLPRGATMSDVAATVVAVLDDLGLGSAHVYGHNTGRLIAAALAAEAPERVGRLMIAGPTFTLVPEQEERISAIRSFVQDRYFNGSAISSASDRARHDWAALCRTLAGWWWDERVFSCDDPEPIISALADRIGDELAARDGVAAMYAMNFDFDLAVALRSAKARTLIIEIVGGACDHGGFPRQGDRLAAQMADASVVTLTQTEGLIALELLTGMRPMAEVIRAFAVGASR